MRSCGIAWKEKVQERKGNSRGSTHRRTLNDWGTDSCLQLEEESDHLLPVKTTHCQQRCATGDCNTPVAFKTSLCQSSLQLLHQIAGNKLQKLCALWGRSPNHQLRNQKDWFKKNSEMNIEETGYMKFNHPLRTADGLKLLKGRSNTSVLVSTSTQTIPYLMNCLNVYLFLPSGSLQLEVLTAVYSFKNNKTPGYLCTTILQALEK